MTQVYRNGLKKSWLFGIIPPIFVAFIIPMSAMIFPELKNQADALKDMMASDFYQGALGSLGLMDLGTWTGVFSMYVFMWLEFIILFVAIFIPARLISTEADKNTLDFILSFPVPRWRYLLDKFYVYLSFNLLYPIIILFVTFIVTEGIGEEIDYLAVAYSTIGIWFLLFTLGSLSLFCGVLFLDSTKGISASGVIILSMFILERMAGLVDSLKIYQNLSLFHYLNAGRIMSSGNFPLDELIIVLSVGIIALLGALYTFQKKELAY
ncbi:MAG: ABC transporter permease subunit [Candidatus Hodarchaeales archaeon]